jgi:hypothetical protein
MLKPEVLNSLNSLTTFDEIKEAWAHLKHRAKLIEGNAARALHVGQNVQWSGRKGHQTGVIEAINPRTISVRTPENVLWKVSPTLLRNA